MSQLPTQKSGIKVLSVKDQINRLKSMSQTEIKNKFETEKSFPSLFNLPEVYAKEDSKKIIEKGPLSFSHRNWKKTIEERLGCKKTMKEGEVEQLIGGRIQASPGCEVFQSINVVQLSKEDKHIDRYLNGDPGKPKQAKNNKK